AYNKGDFTTAAKEYARADSLAPNPVALQAALDSAVKGDDPAIGAELLERAKSREATGALSKSIAAAHAKLDHRAGKLSIACMDCTATVDGQPFTSGWVRAGKHDVLLTRANVVETKSVDVAADSTVEVSPTPAPPPPQNPPQPPLPHPQPQPQPQPQPLPHPQPQPQPTPKTASGGISPIFFFTGVGL